MTEADRLHKMPSALSPVHQAHADLIAKLAAAKPTRIITERGADETDIALREMHIRAVTGNYLRYVKAMVEDLNEHLVAGEKKVDCGQFVAAFVDVATGYLYAPMHAALSAASASPLR
jgi:tetrahydromethanopterin S-methyltransferase subunit F